MSTTIGENLSALSIRRTLDGYRGGTLSPVDVVQSCVEAVARLDQRLHAWTCFDPEKALAQARASARRILTAGAHGGLEGIPVGVKDVFNTVDFPTEMGSRLWKGYTPGNDARAVFSLRQAGAIVPGKTATAEFAVHALGDTVNPHDAARTPGTSSSGSAVAVATGMVPVALGTQTGGSIIRPASYCGVYGFKPSFGLIPRTGTLKTTDSLDTVGFLARHLEDLEPMLDVLRVHGRNYPVSDAALGDEVRQSAPRGRPWRVALAKTHTWGAAQPYARDALLQWGARLASTKGFDVAEVPLPSPLDEAHQIHATIYDKTLAYYFAEEFKQPELMSPIMLEIVARGAKVTRQAYLDALEAQSRMAAAMDVLFHDHDIVLSLSTAGDAPLRHASEPPDPALVWTACHLPAVSVPKFFSPPRLPFGVQVVARRYNDLQLLRFLSFLLEIGEVPASAPAVSGDE
jgi:Asp-tRNA(Asn)/Glu-tRNA(Gln) amidotransferase A subunit family amidase